MAIRKSYLAIRKAIGILGLLLPALVIFFHGELLTSISHYYYARSAVFFIGIMFSFGLFLISYRGYEKDTKTEKLSDNTITNIGGFAALMVIFFPTSCLGSGGFSITCYSEGLVMFGHVNKYVSAVHLISAGLFLFIMGWISIYRFTKTKENVILSAEKKRNNRVYKFCGFLVWISLGVLIFEFAGQLIWSDKFQLSDYDIILFETIAVMAFGISWLVKGDAIEDLIDIRRKYFRTGN